MRIPPPPTPPVVIAPRKALANTAYRLTYAEHILQNEFDEIESALTEEDAGHQNIAVLALAMQHLSAAQARLAAAIKLFPAPTNPAVPTDHSTPN